MPRFEQVELTNVCLLHRDGKYLLQNRVSSDWHGYALPGGHVEPNESIVESVRREMKEETGLDVINPRLCGIKQFPKNGGRYLVFLFEATEFSGELRSSDEGEMRWLSREQLKSVKTVDDLELLIDTMLDPNLSEFQYIVEDGEWRVILG